VRLSGASLTANFERSPHCNLHQEFGTTVCNFPCYYPSSQFCNADNGRD